MADLDEDQIHTTQPDEEEDGDNLAQDYRQLSSKSGYKIPKRGDKDFEPHGTKHQDGILESQRQAMHDVLNYTRVYPPKSHIRAFYYGEESLRRDEVIHEEWRQGLDDDHVVVVETAKQSFSIAMGSWTKGKPVPTLWLLPEEALYLVERGSLDMWWPTSSSFKHAQNKREDNDTEDESVDEKDEGTPMSLQAAYAMLIGREGQRGKVTMEKYNVYSNLRRAGYVVQRAWEWDPKASGLGNKDVQEPYSIFNWIFGRLFAEEEIKHPAYGPLVQPGMYRSYNSIYRQIAIIPRHKPLRIPDNPTPEHPYKVSFHLWKAAAGYSKRNAGPPDFRVAVADARVDSIPTLKQMTSLLESTPWDPPPSSIEDPVKVNQRLKHGWRNVLLAVVDQGVVSFMRLSEAAFGEELLSERFDRGGTRGTKRGGSRGRGRGRGGRGSRGG